MTSKILLSLLLCFLLAHVSKAQSDCSLAGGYVCSGGRILTIDFGQDDDDDTFRYSAVFTSGGEECNILQEGVYDVNGATITASFDDDEEDCERTPDNSVCQCLDSFDMTASGSCAVIAGPNGETCTPAPDCEDSFTCPNGETPVQGDYQPTSNGCGTNDFPVPALSFDDCCGAHDICYGTCGTSKVQCDNDFYQCMACTCGNDLFDFACDQLACSYYEAVEEFGCPAFNNAQNRACTCPNSAKSEEKESNVPVMSKFGPIHPALRKTDFVCNAPFDAACSGDDDDNAAHLLTMPWAVLLFVLVFVCGMF